MSNKPLEIEFKYRANNISLDKFKEFCISKDPEVYEVISGYDHFFSSKLDKDCFYRHRIGSHTNQLTLKKKTAKDNNFVRVEHNIDLHSDTTLEQIRSMCEDIGFQYNTSIFKTSFIYIYQWYIMAYYVVYDVNMLELGRFIEIEIREDAGIETEGEAWNELIVMERVCKNLGLMPKNRVKDSLFEIFRKKI